MSLYHAMHRQAARARARARDCPCPCPSVSTALPRRSPGLRPHGEYTESFRTLHRSCVPASTTGYCSPGALLNIGSCRSPSSFLARTCLGAIHPSAMSIITFALAGRLNVFGWNFKGSQFHGWRLTTGKKVEGRSKQRWQVGVCRAALPDDAPFALAIGASILSTLILPVGAKREVDKDEEPLFGADDALSGGMQIISFIPFFNWLVWVFAWLDSRKNPYLLFAAIYLAPYLKSGLSLSPEDSWLPIGSLLACVAHVQLDIAVNVEGQSPLGDLAKGIRERIQTNDEQTRPQKEDGRPLQKNLEAGEQKQGAEWKAILDDAKRKEFAEWDQKFSRSKVEEEAAKEIDS